MQGSKCACLRGVCGTWLVLVQMHALLPVGCRCSVFCVQVQGGFPAEHASMAPCCAWEVRQAAATQRGS